MHPEDCQICGQTGHGSHFGVISCRACAAFFRRSADSKWTKMGCLSRHCDGKFYHCKPCRLKRCRDVGMDSSKFQPDRDPIMASRKRKLPSAFEEFLGRPHVVLFCSTSSESTPKRKTFIDTRFLIEKASEILKTGCQSTPWMAKSHLEKLSFGFQCHADKDKLKRLPDISRNETSKLWEFYLLTTARWLTHFQPFQDLEEPLKLQILLATWHVWSRLHKLIATALYRNSSGSVKSLERVTGDGLLVDVSSPKSDIEWMSGYPKEQLSYFLEGMRGADLCPLIDHLKVGNFSKVELTFMMGQLCFQYASRRFPGIAEVLDGFQEILANDLHRYYSKDQKTLRYSERIGKMMKVNNAIQENIRKHRERAEIARTFGVFHLEFSHPNMFIDTPIN